jgi:uncharacterized protein
MMEADDRVIVNILFFNDWINNPPGGDFWQNVDGENRASKIKVPLLSMAGWFDPFLGSQIQDFEDISRDPLSHISKESRLIIGPWAHAETVKIPN